jgi:hypothetical protein
MNPDQLSTAFYMVARLADKLGEAPIKDKLWTHKVDDHWLVKINGCPKEKESIPPYHMMVEFNGFPAGCVSPFEGVFAAGTEANEDGFIDAVIVKLESLGVDVSEIKEEDMRKKGQARISEDQAVKEMNEFIDDLEE